MKFTITLLSAILLALGANAAVIPDGNAELIPDDNAELTANRFGICRVAENQCVIYYRNSENRVNCRTKCSKEGAPCRIGRIPHRAHCK
ncbi:hypothetical protein CMUS01_13549 [Colletotrichum musicola]|uniref:Antifungal protein n=1 Tax=Colletotrichum musicola TaxID=2175873 RepID=A0A8H6JBW2_9PEZI|nr:hypothetical protein CMUS01_13549 [Colletotrichum musicola]